MMNNKTFSAMCEELLAAERKMSQYKTCWDNLPADTNYELGARVEWQWGASCDGYKETQQAVQRAFQANLRQAIKDVLVRSETEVAEARKAVVMYAQGHGQ